jgi:L-lactate dehydrogenase complex protein LldG
VSSREDILARVRKNQPAPQPLPAVPTFDTDHESPSSASTPRSCGMGGKLADPPADGDLQSLIGRLFPDAKVICSATPRS